MSGYLLMFPFYVTNIFGMQIAQVVHSIVAVLFVALIIAHIYIGTLGMEGAFEAMGTGERRLQLGEGASRAVARGSSSRKVDVPSTSARFGESG